jgi:hypothetical protein
MYVWECVFGLVQGLSVIAARQCMHVSESEFWLCAMSMTKGISVRRCMYVWDSVFGLVQGAWSL